MDKDSTLSSLRLRNLIRSALMSDNYGAPSEKTLAFIRNYAATLAHE
ncbi:MAG: hypothetical protein J5732_05310 [Bacteroidaceae bacterium]|nr:hypothetical protein [Bacteroidaceae bacterium]